MPFDYQICVHVHMGKDVAGTDITPYASITIHQDFDLPKNTAKTSALETNKPVWDYSYSTSKKNVQMEEFLDSVFELNVKSGLFVFSE